MSFSEKPQVEGGGFESDNENLVIAEIGLRTPLTPISTAKTIPIEKEQKEEVTEEGL